MDPGEVFKIAPCAAIESEVLVVGRIVVCVEADADVSTAMINKPNIEKNGEPKAVFLLTESTSSELSTRNFVPANA